MFGDLITLKELSLATNPNTLNSVSFQPDVLMNLWYFKHRLCELKEFTGLQDIGIRKLEFTEQTQFLCGIIANDLD